MKIVPDVPDLDLFQTTRAKKNKNDSLQSKIIPTLKLPRFPLSVQEVKNAAISKLELFLTEWSRSYIVLALMLPRRLLGLPMYFIKSNASLKIFARSYMHNKVFILAHSNQLQPLFSKLTDPKQQQKVILKTAITTLLAVKNMYF